MSRAFSIVRRRANLIDLITPVRPGVDEYRLKWAANFDTAAPWTQIVSCPSSGYLDPVINPAVLHDVPGPYVRIVFDPASFSIPDDLTFWMTFVPVTSGAEGTESPPTMILSEDARRAMGLITIAGNAPSGADVSDALQIDLPARMKDINIHNNDDTKKLYLATEAGGAENVIAPKESRAFYGSGAGQGSLFVRGESAVVEFSAALMFLVP